MKIEIYRNLTIRTGDYMDTGKYFWEVLSGGNMLANTLQSDDKGWDSHEHAAECARRQIDLWIDYDITGYFNRKYKPE